MEAQPIYSKQPLRESRTGIAGIVVMLLAVVVTLMLLTLNSDITAGFPYFYIIPWLVALLAVFLIPTGILIYQGKFSIYNPLILATYWYFIPAFVFGGLALAAGLSQPYFLVFIQDARTNLPLTIQLIMLGYAGLAIGYFLPIGSMAGELTSRLFRKSSFPDESYVIPGLVLLGLGGVNSIFSLLSGLFGFQRGAEIGAYDGIIILATLLWLQASFLLWLIVFRQEKFDARAYFLMVVLLATALVKALFAGNRGSLIQVFNCVLLAYIMSGRQLRFKQVALAGVLLAFALIAGTIYGTTFRDVKGSEERQSAIAYTENVFNTIDKIGKNDNLTLLGYGLMALAERIDTLSSVAVVVSNYEQLAPYEESYGLDDNISKDLKTFLIPRFIWNDKPVSSDARKFSELYFNFGENSFAITPIGDLVRNFGVMGVPIGMLLLGIVLRGIYRSLIEDQVRVIWRSTLYFMLVTTISYEGFYGGIIPFMFKVGVIAIVGILLVTVLAKWIGGVRQPAV
jgi:hypothetical protein